MQISNNQSENRIKRLRLTQPENEIDSVFAHKLATLECKF